MAWSRFLRETIGVVLIVLFLFLFFFVDFTGLAHIKDIIPKSWMNVNTIFLSIFLEAAPFVLIGVFVSSIIQTFITENQMKKVIPRNPFLAVIPASLVGLVFPMCECVIVPVVRRLIQKGMPLHIGMVILVSAPILNPIVFASTYYAFRTTPYMAYYRLGLAFVAAVIIGFVVYCLYRNQNMLKDQAVVDTHIHPGVESRWKQILQHAADEFFSTGKFLLIGALIASCFQTFLDRQLLEQVASNNLLSPAVMMGLGYVLSLCSEADAFIAASLTHTFSAPSLLAFLVFGPMLDIKNTLMLLAYFKKRFVVSFFIIVLVVVYAVVQCAKL